MQGRHKGGLVIAKEQHTREGAGAPSSVWCYLAEVGGYMLALPDDERTVLLPYISSISQVTALPATLTPSYVLGLVNVSQRAELLIDLARLLGLRDTPLPPEHEEGRRMVVYGEGSPPAQDPHRLAFALDTGYELAEGTPHGEPSGHPLGVFVQRLLLTPRGIAALIEMEMVCNKVLHDLAAPRLWNEPEPSSEKTARDV